MIRELLHRARHRLRSLPEGPDVPSAQRALGLSHDSPRHHCQRVCLPGVVHLRSSPAERPRPWHPLSGMGIGRNDSPKSLPFPPCIG